MNSPSTVQNQFLAQDEASVISPIPYPMFSDAAVGSGLVRWSGAQPAFVPNSYRLHDDVELRNWQDGIKAVETYPHAQRALWDHHSADLKMRIQQLEQKTSDELRSLASRVDILTRTLSSVMNASSSAENMQQTDFETDTSELSLAESINRLIDLNLLPSEADKATIEESVTHIDPGIRAAAGRGLCFTNPPLALKLLPELIGKEKNRFVASVLKGALRAIE